ncbi:MAG: Fur family transcriptional regulator [Coprobacillaceae bacterium]
MQKTRYSKQRELIYNNLKSRRDHPTAEDIYASLKQENPALSLGTVYRNLNFLTEAKLVRKLQVGEQTIHFDADLQPHYHFICQKCNNIHDIDAHDIQSVISDEIRKHTSHIVLDTNITLSGICVECQKEDN